MKILILASYFRPEIAASLYLFDNIYEKFSQRGFHMSVYAPIPCRGISEKQRLLYKKTLKKESFYDGKMNIFRFSLMRERKNPLQRAFRYFISCFIQLYYASKDKSDVLFVASTPPIQGAMAACVKKITHIPIVYNLQDIFPDSLVSTGLASKNSWLWKIGRKIENFTYANADKIIVISEGFKQNIMAKGVPENKIEVVYNWVDEQAVIHVPRENNILFERYQLDPSKFYITYCGNIGMTQNMDLLLDIAQDLSFIVDLHFVLIGDGAYRKNVEQKIKELQIANISLLPFQPYEDISHVFSLGDIGLVISKPGVGENSVPSKTWSIMSAEQAIIANFDENELKNIIEENHCGIFTKAGDKKALSDAILYLYKNREICSMMGKNGRNYILKNLTKEIGASKYADVIESVCQKK